MGLIKEIVLLPVAPLRFTVWVAEQVAEEADRRETSQGARVRQIAEVEEAREQGRIDEAKARAIEGRILREHSGGPTVIDADDTEEGSPDG